MGYKGSSRRKVSDIVGIEALEVLMSRKRTRWTASVYGRHEPELRPRAERILREEIGPVAELRSLKGETRGWRRDLDNGRRTLRE